METPPEKPWRIWGPFGERVDPARLRALPVLGVRDTALVWTQDPNPNLIGCKPPEDVEGIRCILNLNDETHDYQPPIFCDCGAIFRPWPRQHVGICPLCEQEYPLTNRAQFLYGPRYNLTPTTSDSAT